MAFVRELVIMTFDGNDTSEEKQHLLKAFEGKGYNRIAETTLTETGEIKEWILQGPIQNGKIRTAENTPVKATKEDKAKADLFKFKP